VDGARRDFAVASRCVPGATRARGRLHRTSAWRRARRMRCGRRMTRRRRRRLRPNGASSWAPAVRAVL